MLRSQAIFGLDEKTRRNWIELLISENLILAQQRKNPDRPDLPPTTALIVNHDHALVEEIPLLVQQQLYRLIILVDGFLTNRNYNWIAASTLMKILKGYLSPVAAQNVFSFARDENVISIIKLNNIKDSLYQVSAIHLNYENDDVKKALKYRLRGKNISIELNGQSEIVSDASKLFLVLKNIVANAIDYGESNSVVIIESKTDESTTISITNIGKPPAVEYKPQVFTRFAHDASGAHGLGIGLSIAKGLCERLDGAIDYNSDERSVSFVITLPKLSNALISANACGANEFLFEKFDDAFEL